MVSFMMKGKIPYIGGNLLNYASKGGICYIGSNLLYYTSTGKICYIGGNFLYQTMSGKKGSFSHLLVHSPIPCNPSDPEVQDF